MANPKLFTGVGSPQSIYESSSVQYHPIGSRAGLDDGRVFYYARNAGTALVAGNATMAEVITDQFGNQAVAAAAAAGVKEVTVTLGSTAVTENEYADGYLMINDEAGEGHTYRIAGHPAAAGAASCVLELLDGIVVALTTSSEYCLVKNPWADVLIAAAGSAHQVVGVAAAAITANEYGWLQTWGPAAVLTEGANVIGDALHSGTAGALLSSALVDDMAVGYQMYTGAAGEYRPVFLTIAP